jgi:hypothetical protein
MFVAAWCVFQALRNWLQTQTMFNMFFLLIAISAVLRSFSETDLAIEFGAVMIYICAARFGVPQPEALEQSSRNTHAPSGVARVRRGRLPKLNEWRGRP